MTVPPRKLDGGGVRPPLPAGLGLALDPGVRRVDGGRVLVGGAPVRLVRVTDTGSDLVDGWLTGEAVPPRGPGAALARRLLDAGIAHPRLGGVAPPFTPADVAVVVPVHGGAAGLGATLAALGPVGEVVVVDDASPDGAGLACTAAEAGARLIRHDRNRGPGPARDTGWRATDRPVVAFVDAEVEPSPGWLEPLLAHLADATVVAVAPRVRARSVGARHQPIGSTGGPPPGWLEAYEEVRSPLDMGASEAVVRPRSAVPYVPTAALVVRRATLEAVDGFDAGLRYGEDVDLVWRLAAAGGIVRYEPAVEVTHPVRPTVAAWVRQRVGYGTSAAPLAARHGAAVAPLRVSGWSAAAWGAAVLGHPVAGAAVAVGSTAALARKLSSLDHPVAEAVHLAGWGHLLAGEQVLAAVRRAWLPLVLAGAVRSRRARALAVAAVAVPPLLERVRGRAGLDPLRWAALRLADDAAYGAGVWLGCLRERGVRALLPASAGAIDRP